MSFPCFLPLANCPFSQESANIFITLNQKIENEIQDLKMLEIRNKINNMKKEFDAVKEMRAIREKLQKEYEKNPSLRRKRLEQIHKKYGLSKRAKEIANR